MEWLLISEKIIWFGLAALGFAILFNVPERTLWVIFAIAALGGFTKVALVHLGASVIIGSFAGATLIGLLSIPLAHYRHTPPLILSIPALIPMVPGAFAYRTMLGMMKLATNVADPNYSTIVNDTLNNGLKTFLILLTLAAGASIPMLLTRKSSAKQLFKLKTKKD
jgi:uncharacterized membrane protein YjjB (DUF3815 family)